LVILNPLSYYYFFHRFVTCKFDNFHPSRLIMDDSINSTKKEKNFTLSKIRYILQLFKPEWMRILRSLWVNHEA
jgi:hypothetical protein